MNSNNNPPKNTPELPEENPYATIEEVKDPSYATIEEVKVSPKNAIEESAIVYATIQSVGDTLQTQPKQPVKKDEYTKVNIKQKTQKNQKTISIEEDSLNPPPLPKRHYSTNEVKDIPQGGKAEEENVYETYDAVQTAQKGKSAKLTEQSKLQSDALNNSLIGDEIHSESDKTKKTLVQKIQGFATRIANAFTNFTNKITGHHGTNSSKEHTGSNDEEVVIKNPVYGMFSPPIEHESSASKEHASSNKEEVIIDNPVYGKFSSLDTPLDAPVIIELKHKLKTSPTKNSPEIKSESASKEVDSIATELKSSSVKAHGNENKLSNPPIAENVEAKNKGMQK